ncbi:MAG: fatty acid desaturase [Thermoanaerobaculia bacterium]
MKVKGAELDLGQPDDKYRSRQAYANELRAHLPKEVFQAVPRRLLWLIFYYAIISLGVVAIFRWENPVVRFLAAVMIGHCQGVLGFLGHEILHGTVVRRRLPMLWLGGLCMWHWGIHPKHWIAWHNRQHHQLTNHSFDDPDCFGHERLYHHSTWLRVLEKFLPGSGTARSALFLFFWFSFHTVWVAFKHPGVFQGHAEARTVRAFIFGTQIGWITLAGWALGWQGFFFLYLIPLAFANLIMMSYVATNHFISPLTEDTNDPLLNSLTVRSTPLLERLHLYNNFHVEHHVLPYVNPVHGAEVARKLKELWPQKYQEMSHWAALRRVYRSPKFYLRNTVLVNPRTRFTAETLLAHYLEMD